MFTVSRRANGGEILHSPMVETFGPKKNKLQMFTFHVNLCFLNFKRFCKVNSIILVVHRVSGIELPSEFQLTKFEEIADPFECIRSRCISQRKVFPRVSPISSTAAFASHRPREFPALNEKFRRYLHGRVPRKGSFSFHPSALLASVRKSSFLCPGLPARNGR